jgi:hypothetical protein
MIQTIAQMVFVAAIMLGLQLLYAEPEPTSEIPCWVIADGHDHRCP